MKEKSKEIELHTDAWERFERAAGVVSSFRKFRTIYSVIYCKSARPIAEPFDSKSNRQHANECYN
jgi:hypothetical protein